MLVIDQLLIEGLELDAFVGIRTLLLLELGRLHEDEMLKRAGCGLCPRVHPVANRPALHEDDRVVTVLACDGRRQPQNETGFGLTCHLLETVRRQVGDTRR